MRLNEVIKTCSKWVRKKCTRCDFKATDVSGQMCGYSGGTLVPHMSTSGLWPLTNP